MLKYSFTMTWAKPLLSLLILTQLTGINGDVDCQYCYNKYPLTVDTENVSGIPLQFMGISTDNTKFMISPKGVHMDFGQANAYCLRYNYILATPTTNCHYCIIDRWFKYNYNSTGGFEPAWIGGLRWGTFGPYWITTGSAMDLLATFGMYGDGPYYPGGYSPIPYPWVNCLSCVRTCPAYGSGQQNPCTQTQRYPNTRFQWDDCRNMNNRVICQVTDQNYPFVW